MRIIIKTAWHIIEKNYRVALIALCTIALCWIGVWRDIGNGAQWSFAINCTGLPFAIMTAIRYDWKKVKKWPYLIWTMLCVVGAYPAFCYFSFGNDYDLSVIMAIIDVFALGIILIRGLQYYGGCKKYRCIGINTFFLVWLWFIAFAILSINKAIWPLWFLFMLGLFYTAPFDMRFRKELIIGFLSGIIISFFWIQGRAFLYRPYDESERYYGHFTNPNINAHFYMVAYCAFLTVYTYFKKIKNKLLQYISIIISIGICDLVLLTGSRGMWVSFFLMTFMFFVINEFFCGDRKIFCVFSKGIIMLVMVLLLFAPTYLCARYIPALRHHPIWYGDYSEDKVHSWDPIDSDKYVSFSEVVNMILGRFSPFNYVPSNSLSEQTIVYRAASPCETIAFNTTVIFKDSISVLTRLRTEEYAVGTWIYEYDDGIDPGTDPEHPAMEFKTWEYDKGILGIRKYIHKYFIERFNLLGHEEIYPYVWFMNNNIMYGDVFPEDIYGKDFSPPIYFGHTHSSYIQFYYNFGVPAGILWTILILGPVIYIFVYVIRRKEITVEYLFVFLLNIGYALDGLVECLCLPGKFLFICIFVNLIFLMRNKEDTTKRDMEVICAE